MLLSVWAGWSNVLSVDPPVRPPKSLVEIAADGVILECYEDWRQPMCVDCENLQYYRG
jgi:hypothetical protein